MYYPPHYPQGFSGEPYQPYIPPPRIRRIPGEDPQTRRAFKKCVKLFVKNEQEEYAKLLESADKLHDKNRSNPSGDIERIAPSLLNLTPEEQAEKDKKRRLRVMTTAGFGCVALLAGVTYLAIHDSERDDGFDTREQVATSATALRQLSICAADMQAQLEYDVILGRANPKNEFMQERIVEDRLAVKTAHHAHLPCEERDVIKMAEIAGPNGMAISVSREVLTNFEMVDWPAQRKEFTDDMRSSNSKTYDQGIQEQIQAGDLAAKKHQG